MGPVQICFSKTLESLLFSTKNALGPVMYVLNEICSGLLLDFRLYYEISIAQS